LAQKLVAELGDCLRRQGDAAGYTLCGKNATPSFLKNHWVKVGSVHNYFKVCRFSKARIFYRKIESRFNEGIIRDAGSLPQFFAEHEFNPRHSGIFHFRSRRYLEWRLKDPYHKYRILSYNSEGVTKGYLIYNERAAGNAAYIMGLEADNGERKVLTTLLEAVELLAYRAGRGLIIAIAVKDSVFRKVLTENGYWSNPFKRGPLASLLDFNVLYGGKIDARAVSKEKWDICSLNYDDI
jgi:hypothetical protein